MYLCFEFCKHKILQKIHPKHVLALWNGVGLGISLMHKYSLAVACHALGISLEETTFFGIRQHSSAQPRGYSGRYHTCTLSGHSLDRVRHTDNVSIMPIADPR